MNLSVIVFSRGRSLQLNAYLESLLKFSDVKQCMISVLYAQMEKIDYGKVIKSYPDVHWIKEKSFEEDLRRLIEDAETYIMFGCDDVVFKDYFSLNKAIAYLELYPDIFGFSNRLGFNIKPYPVSMHKESDILVWNWQNCREAHYNYPWELDCTLYRKEDVQRLTAQEQSPIKNPNYFEAMITAENKKERITRVRMASWKKGCAAVITVNRVQETHPNGFDDCMETDIYSLDRLYNDKGNTFDIERLARKENYNVHVGAEYFFLRKPEKGFSKKYLLKKRIKALIVHAAKLRKRVWRYIERRYYKKGGYKGKINILTPEETLTLLEAHKNSFLRYGDGEIAIMMGSSIPFQEYNKELSKRLRHILNQSGENIKIGIPYYYINPLDTLNRYVENFVGTLSSQRRFLLKSCRRGTAYIDTCITQMYQTYEEYNFEAHYSRMQALLSNRDITLICGEGIFEKLEHRAFDVCMSVEWLYAAETNAYSNYGRLLKKALMTDKNRLVCIVLGPTAKVLAYDLHKAGYQAWDMGHYFKDFDAYMRNAPRTEEKIKLFFAPD